jgi:Trk-type K+ transport system membrane component
VTLTFTIYTGYTIHFQLKYRFFKTKCRFLLRFSQYSFMVLFMGILTYVAFAAEFSFGNVLSKKLTENTLKGVIMSIALAVFVEVILLLINLLYDLKSLIFNKKKKQGKKNLAKISSESGQS